LKIKNFSISSQIFKENLRGWNKIERKEKLELLSG